MGDLGVVCTWIPLLLSALLAHLYSSKRAGKGDCNLSEDHPGKKLDVKEIAGNRQNITNSIPLPDQWGNFIWGGCTSFGMRLYASLLDTTDGGYGKYGHPKDRRNRRSIMEPAKRFYRKEWASAGSSLVGVGNPPTAFNRTPGTSVETF